jgi:hypothetical protein
MMSLATPPPSRETTKRLTEVIMWEAWEAWDNFNNVFVGQYETKEEAKAAAQGYAMWKGIFRADVSVYLVVRE